MATASLRLTGNVIFNNATGNARMQMEQIGFPAYVIATGRLDNARLPLEPSITGNLTPTANILYSLGNATHRWKELYLAGNTLFLGNSVISESSGGGISINAGSAVALGQTRVLGNLVVEGNLTVLGGNVVEIQTETQITDQLIVTNAGTGPALIVEQTGAEDIATFKDDGNVVVRIHDGSGAMSVGGDVANPYAGASLHVVGNVYASGTYVGNGASLTSLNASAVTMGTQVRIGEGAGQTIQGSNAVAIGSLAGYSNQASNSIVINATGSPLENAVANSCVIKPVRDFAGTVARRVAMYDATSGEISTNSGHLTMNVNNTMLVGTTSVNATGAGLQVMGLGQNTLTAFNTAGNMGGSLLLKTTDGIVYSGGAVVFGASQGDFAAIKGALTNGGGNTLGHLIFATRNATSDSTLTTKLIITDTNVNIPGNISFNNQTQNNMITLFGSVVLDSTDSYGFGINSSTLRYNVPAGSVHRWYHGTSLSMTLGRLGYGDPYIELRGTTPTMTFRDTDHRTGYIHVNGGTFHILTGNADAATEGWGQSANGRWPLLIIMGNNNAEFGGDVRYVSAGVYSDRRIKKNFRDLNDNESLEILRQIEPVAYSYIDAQGRGLGANVETIGFVAQQIESVLPHAVSTSTGVVPSVYAYGTVDSEDETIVHLDGTDVPFDAGDLVVVRIGDASYHVRCASKPSSTSFQYEPAAASSSSGAIATPEAMPGPGEPLFVYGHEVEDFKSIKKDVVFTVALAATQELDRQLQAAKMEIKNLKAQNASFESRLAALEAS